MKENELLMYFSLTLYNFIVTWSGAFRDSSLTGKNFPAFQSLTHQNQFEMVVMLFMDRHIPFGSDAQVVRISLWCFLPHLPVVVSWREEASVFIYLGIHGLIIDRELNKSIFLLPLEKSSEYLFYLHISYLISYQFENIFKIYHLFTPSAIVLTYGSIISCQDL